MGVHLVPANQLCLRWRELDEPNGLSIPGQHDGLLHCMAQPPARAWAERAHRDCGLASRLLSCRLDDQRPPLREEPHLVSGSQSRHVVGKVIAELMDAGTFEHGTSLWPGLDTSQYRLRTQFGTTSRRRIPRPGDGREGTARRRPVERPHARPAKLPTLEVTANQVAREGGMSLAASKVDRVFL